jgi:hypothetical protein
MLKRLGWLGCTLATGLLLHILVQIRWLHWLPEFPGYPALAGLAGIIALVAAPLALIGTSWRTRGSVASFMLLAVVLAGLAGASSSTAIDRWRDFALWFALASGVITCCSLGPWRISLLALWPLASAVTGMFAILYAPSLGESLSWRAYQSVLLAGTITALHSLLLPLTGASCQARWIAAAVLPGPPLLMGVVCLALPESARAGSVLFVVAAVQLVELLIAAYRLASNLAPNESLPSQIAADR